MRIRRGLLRLGTGWALLVCSQIARAQTDTAAATAIDTTPPSSAYPPAVPVAPQPTVPPIPPAPPSHQAPTPEPEDRGYGRRGSTILGLSLGVANGTGGVRYAGGAGFGYFLVTGVAPGADISVDGGGGTLTTTTVTGTLRLVPVRTGQVAFFLIGRAGRLFIASHDDVWGAGGGAGIVIATGGNVGLQLSYEVLGLWPSAHCSDLAGGCRLDAFAIGLIVGF